MRPGVRLLSLLGLLILVSGDEATNPSTEFRVRRRNQNPERRELFTDELFLTYSDDGRSKTLDSFILVMFETPSELLPDALPILRMAMNKFLLTEFNAIYSEDGYPLESVGSEIMWDEITTSNPGGRSLQEQKIGREAEMEVTLSFEQEPSPSRVDLEEKIREVMADLSTFIGNLTSFGHSDWKDVTEAYRLEIETEAPVEAPTDDTDSIEGPTGRSTSNSDRGNNSVVAIVPMALIAASLITLVIFLLVQRRRRSATDVSTKGGTTMFVGVANDVFNVDRSLESARSPYEMSSLEGAYPYEITSQEGSIAYNLSTDEPNTENSVFCGFDYPSGNTVPATVPATMTNASATTARATNKREVQDHDKTRASPGRSSFAYNQEQLSPYAQDDTPRDYDKSSRAAHSRGDSVFSDVFSDEDARNRSAPNSPSNGEGVRQVNAGGTGYGNYSPYANKFPRNDSNDVLADLVTLENKQTPSQSQTQQINSTGSLYANFFSCTPAMPTATENYGDTKVTARGSFLSCSPTVPSAYETPLTRNAPASFVPADSDTGSIGVTAGKVTQMVYDVEGRPVAMDDSALTSSNTKPPLQSGSRSAPSSPERRRHRPSMFHSLPGWRSNADDYDDNLSQPSTPGDDNMERSLKDFKNTGFGGRYFPFRRNTGQPRDSHKDEYGSNRHRHAGNTPGSDGSAMYQSGAMYSDSARRHVGNAQGSDGSAMYQAGAMDSNGGTRRHAGNTGSDGTAMYQNNAMTDARSGRRHVEKTDMDGTAMYQESTMNPLEWSYNPTDNHSIGESSLSEQDGEAMPRQFLFGRRLSRSGKSSKSNPKDEPKTPMSHHTHDSSSQASRNLISDLVWLENKIADVRQGSTNDPPAVNRVDSLSYVSDDRRQSDPSSLGSEFQKEKNESVMSSIVCRDCFAPPGKLHIVIHSTKDGPAVHTVKPGSSLEGHIFPGDLIISVDNVDTRSYSAEQVMKMMASKSNQERKITVLHFDEED